MGLAVAVRSRFEGAPGSGWNAGRAGSNGYSGRDRRPKEKRTEVRTKDQAGYFIRVWRELRDQVRKMIGKDSRYQAIKAERAKP